MDSLVTGMPGAEGPCVTRDGRIFFVASGLGSVFELGSNGRAAVFAETGGIPAGLQLDSDGTLLLADMRRGILRIGIDGTVADVFSEAERPERGCNDLAFDSEGNLYFTAPEGSSLDEPCGELFCRLKEGPLRRLDAGFAFCNGLAVSADDRLLVVAETRTKTLWAYELASAGRAKNVWTFATVEGSHQGGPDGMDFDAEGNLLVANHGGGVIEVFDPEGCRVRLIETPFAKPSNLHFLGPNSTRLLVTEHSSNSLWCFEYGVRGQLQYGWS